MKIKESKLRLRRIIKEELLNEITSNQGWRAEAERQEVKKDLKTLGDLRKLLQVATNKKKDSIRGGGAFDAAKGMIADLIPGAGTIKDLTSAAYKAYKLPDEAQGQTALDFLNVDDDFSKIVNDEIENAFLKAWADKIENLPDDMPLDSDKLNVNDLLSKFIANKFNKRTVTGYED